MVAKYKSSPARVLEMAATLYPGKSFACWIQRNRGRIAPLHLLLDLVPFHSCVLDVGCGSGVFLGMLALRNQIKNGIGFDSSAPSIARAQQMVTQLKMHDLKAGLSFQSIPAEANWPDGRFDVVTMIDVLHHIPPPQQQKVLLLAYEKVLPGGCLLYKDMSSRPLLYGVANRFHDLIMAKQWIHYVSVTQADTWLRNRGAHIETSGSCRMYWYHHHWRVYRRPRDAYTNSSEEQGAIRPSSSNSRGEIINRAAAAQKLLGLDLACRCQSNCSLAKRMRRIHQRVAS